MGADFKVSDRVRKCVGDYRFCGTVVAAFDKLSGERRYVVENTDGLLMILNSGQLEGAECPAEESEVERLKRELAEMRAAAMAAATRLLLVQAGMSGKDIKRIAEGKGDD